MIKSSGCGEETKYGVSQDASKSSICSKSGCGEETKYGVSQDTSKSSICSKSGCGEEEHDEKCKCTGDFWFDGF